MKTAPDDKRKTPTTAAFVSQKGGVGKSTLARLLAVGAIHRGRKTLLADFDLDQLTCVEWGALRMRAGLEPEVDTRAFKSLKKLRGEDASPISSSPTPAASQTICRPKSPRIARCLSADRRIGRRSSLRLRSRGSSRGAARRAPRACLVEGRPLGNAILEGGGGDEDAGFELLSEHWPQRDGFQADLDFGRAGREARNPYLREIAERMEEALWARTMKAKPR